MTDKKGGNRHLPLTPKRHLLPENLNYGRFRNSSEWWHPRQYLKIRLMSKYLRYRRFRNLSIHRSLVGCNLARLISAITCDWRSPYHPVTTILSGDVIGIICRPRSCGSKCSAGSHQDRCSYDSLSEVFHILWIWNDYWCLHCYTGYRLSLNPCMK